MTEDELTRYTKNLLAMVRKPSLDLMALKLHWPNAQKQIEKWIREERRALSRRIGKDDPIRLPVDLLTPIGRIKDEIVHTRAIAYMLDPDKSHGFKKAVLLSLIKKIQEIGSREDETASILSLLKRKVAIRVNPEYSPHRQDEEEVRNQCDIWIECGSGDDAALVIIENKIYARAGNGQLDRYKKAALDWQKKNTGPVLLIYLTPEKRKETRPKWINLCYCEFASALRSVWVEKKRAAGRTWLGLYIAAAMRGVLEIDIEGRPDAAALANIEAYLGRRGHAK